MSANQSQVLLGGMVFCLSGPGARRGSSGGLPEGVGSLSVVLVLSRGVVIRCLLSRDQATLRPSRFCNPRAPRLARSGRSRTRSCRCRSATLARGALRLAGPPSPPRGPLSRPHAAQVSGPSFDTLAYPAFIDTMWRLPRNPDQAMYNLWQLARLVHDVAAIQEVGIAKLLTGEP